MKKVLNEWRDYLAEQELLDAKQKSLGKVRRLVRKVIHEALNEAGEDPFVARTKHIGRVGTGELPVPGEGAGETCEDKCTEEVINKKGADWKDHPKMVKARSDCMKKCKS